MGKISDFFDKIRRRVLKRGYACDACGAELFNYPKRRLCEACEKKLPRTKNPCPKCGREGISEGVCTTCKANAPKFTQGFSPFVYKGDGAVLLNRLKNGSPRLAAYFGEQMAEHFLERLPITSPLLVVAVPLTKSRERERGYNQAERLAESVVERLVEKGVEVEVDFTLLEKGKETALQKRATQAERRKNAESAYLLRRRKVFEGRTALLIDDVMTSGSTGSACARKILSAGATAVYFLTATAVPEQK